jgi:hypothetical protein
MAKIDFHYLAPLCGKMLYLDEDVYSMSWDSRKASLTVQKLDKADLAASSDKYRIIILGKTHYYEAAKELPISSHQDAGEALALNSEEICPFPHSRIFLRLHRLGEGRSLVNGWFLKTASTELVAPLKPLLVVPETALLSTLETIKDGSASGCIAVVPKTNRTLFCFVDSHAITTSVEFKGTDSAKTSDRFRRMIGQEANTAAVKVLEFPHAYLDTLFRGLMRFSLRDLWHFQFHNPFDLDPPRKKILLRGVSLACVLIFIYISSFSALLYVKESRLEQIYQQKKSALTEFTRMEHAIKERENVYRQVLKRITGYPSKVNLLNMLSERLPEKTVLMNFRVVDRMVEIRGTAPKATDVLSALNDAPEIEGATFISGVQKTNDKKEDLETFAIGFRIK